MAMMAAGTRTRELRDKYEQGRRHERDRLRPLLARCLEHAVIYGGIPSERLAADLRRELGLSEESAVPEGGEPEGGAA